MHIHSFYSDDGEYTPEELVELCVEKGLRYFSIADHNCTDGIEEAVLYCRGKDIRIIPAVELDCTFNGTGLHLLGYGIDYRNPVFSVLHGDIVSQEREASKKRMKLVRQLGIDFSDEVIASLSRNGVITGEMLAEAAMRFDRNHENPLLKPYYDNGSRSDNPYVNFYWDFCAQGKPAYAEVKFISLHEAARIIEETGGVPVLAHPGNNIKEDAEKLQAVVSCGVRGIEAYSSYHDEKQTALYKKFAEKRGLLVTCGSDFHGKTKPSVAIGCSNCCEEEAVISSLRSILEAVRYHG